MSEGNAVSVRFFATLKERTGLEQHSMHLAPGSSVADFKAQLRREIPSLPQEGATLLVAVGKEYAFDEEIIPQGAEIAVFPPVSGG